ncbi:MAG: hypothetical protein MZV63_32425 [Marinilabiliales bacterium]|nr:hypothetical protein [Marinilabiliales bacterium]
MICGGSRVRLVNEGAMPSVTFQTIKNKLYPLDILSVKGPSCKGGQRGQDK